MRKMNTACVKWDWETYGGQHGGWGQFPTTVDALVSDHLGNSVEKEVQRLLELVAYENELSSATAQ